MKKLLFLTCSFILLSITLLSAQTKITGIVISSEDGEPIIGATILVKGTTTGTVTDATGRFNLSVPDQGKLLVISYIGMQTQEIKTAPIMKVVLKPEALNLDEIVVTAMGLKREKKALGYAAQDLKGDALVQAGTSDFASSLQGKVSGVEIKPSSGMPGASSQIVIRGARSFSGNNTPLYVVDGMPINSGADMSTDQSVTGTDYATRAFDIDPSDIESINILKGQAAAALYGVRASNGVIIITTKSGKGGDKNKAVVTINTNMNFDDISRYPDLQNKYAQGSAGKFNPNQSKSWGPLISELPNDPIYGGNVANKLNGQDASKYAGMYYVPQRANAGLDPWVKPAAYDNVRDFFQLGFTYNLSANVAYNTDKSTFSISLGSANQEGIIPSTGMDRYTGKIAAETKLGDEWKAGFSGNFTTSKINKTSSANDGIVATVFPAPTSYDLKGIPSSYGNDPYKQNTYRSTTGFDAAYWSIENNEHNEKTDRFFGSTFLEYAKKFGTAHSLNVRYQLGADSYTTHYQKIWGYGHVNKKGTITNEGFTFLGINSLLTANYSWTINDQFQLDALLGNEFIQNKEKRYYQYGKDFNYPGWNHMNNTVVQNNEESRNQDRTVGFFGSASLAYDNMVYLTVTGRNDYISTMPRGNRSFIYPSVSLGFILTELDALRNDVVTYAKLRASYAEVGQAGRYYDSYYSIPTYGGGFNSYPPYLYPSNGLVAYQPHTVLYDPNLRPQNTKSYELGVDLQFFNNLVGVNYTFSRQNVKDQIFQVPLAASTGSLYRLMNGGRIHTNAHELSVFVNPIRTKDFNWDLGVNFTKMDNYVDELAPGVESIFLGGFVTPQVRAAIGEKFPSIYGVQYARDEEGRVLVDENGLPYAGKPGNLGSASPDFILGFNTAFRWKKVTLSAVFDWKQGGVMYGGTNGLLDYYGISNTSVDARENGVIFPGYFSDGTPNNIEYKGLDAEKYFTRLNDIDESSIFGSSFIKLREVAIKYDVLRTKKIELGVNAFARNFLLWTEYPNLDPESSQGNTNMGGAFERFSLPNTSSYGLGLSVKF